MAMKKKKMKIYTKIGDEGKTTFFGCGLVKKDDPRIESLGALDELNSTIGVTLCYIDDEELKTTLKKIQNDLFQVGADLVGSALKKEATPRINEVHLKEMEEDIDRLQDKLGMPKKFILPGGTPSSAFLHLCRSITRRAERSLVKAKDTININPEMMKYVNRLSDFLYVLARQANKESEVDEQQPIYKYFDGDETEKEKNIDGGEARVGSSGVPNDD